MPSNVYFTDFHTTAAENQLQKLKRLMLTAGARQIDWKGKFVAIKIHFGEPGNLAFLRPNYAPGCRGCHQGVGRQARF